MVEIPSYVSQLQLGSRPQVQFTDAPAQALNRLGSATASIAQDMNAELKIAAKEMKDKSDKIEELNATTDFRANMHRIAQNSGSDVNLLKSSLDGYSKGFLEKTADPLLRAKFSLNFQTEGLTLLDSARKKQDDRLNEELDFSSRRSIAQNTTSMSSLIQNLSSEIPQEREAAATSLEKLSKETYTEITRTKPDGSSLYTPIQQMAMFEDIQKAGLLALPPEQRLLALGGSGFDAVLKVIHLNEGAKYVPDGKGFANFGINSVAHPDVDVRTLTQESADAIYKKDYWDKFKVGELRGDQQAIVMDGVVNHGGDAGFGKRLLEKARSGATSTELLTMRQNEYDRLSASGKYSPAIVKSWNRRLSNLAPIALSGSIDFISPDSKIAMANSAAKEIAKIEKQQAIVAKKQFLLKSVDDGSVNFLNSKDKKEALESHYELTMQSNPPRNTQELLTMGANYVEKYDAVPPQVQNQLKGMLRSGKPEDIVLSTAFIGKIQQDNPNVLDDFSKEDIRHVDLATSLMQRGLAPEKVAEKLDALSNVPKENIQAIEQSYSAAVKKDKTDMSIILDKFGYEAPSLMQSQFNQIAIEEMSIHGDKDAAQATALKQLQTTWGASNINGDTKLERLPPEMFYGVDGLSNEQNAEWIRKQAIKQYKETYLTEEGDVDVKISYNDRSKGAPRYIVLVTDKDGLMTPMDFKPDFNTSALKKSNDKLKTDTVENAKKRWLENRDRQPSLLEKYGFKGWKTGQ